jgi:hypothetical protein
VPVRSFCRMMFSCVCIGTFTSIGVDMNG